MDQTYSFKKRELILYYTLPILYYYCFGIVLPIFIMSSQTRSPSMKVKKFISDILKEDTNVNIVTSDVLVKLLETKEEFYSNVIDEFKTNSFRIVENMNMGFEKLANAITNISSNHTDHNKELLQKLDVLCSSINKTNAIVGIPTGNQNTEYIKVFKDELNERKMKFYQAFT